MDSEIERLLATAKRELNDSPELEMESIEYLNIPKLHSALSESKDSEEKTSSISLKPVPEIKKKREVKTAGKQWFDMKEPEMTPELKRDIQLLRMRHALDPKRFYKKEPIITSKHFAVGTVKEAPTEYFSARLTRKQRKQTLAEDILATRSDYFKDKYHQIQKKKTSGGRKHYKNIRKMRS